MRLPRLRQLTEEQKRVYLYAPTDRHVLIHGPPGTGKTLIACLRALELQKRKVPVMLGMFSNVLARYSSNAAAGERLPSATILSWFREWWHASGLPPHLNCGSITLQVPFEQKNLARAAGAEWDPGAWRPWARGRGAWVVEADRWHAQPAAFSSWRLWHSPPTAAGNPQAIDWSAVAAHILEHEEQIPDAQLSLGSLLIDEGQDFPKHFYLALRNICAAAAARGGRVQHPPRCFVLADENQQLTEENSTLEEIREALKIHSDHCYLLLDNFRNSREIALLARSFFADVGKMPHLPERRSAKPTFSVVGQAEDIITRIKTWVINNPAKEVGVFVFEENKRDQMVAALRDALKEVRGREILVQTYSWKTREENRADSLVFDQGDTVTVLNLQSCKGLEFDAVFIVDLHQARIGPDGPDRFKMQMFVAVSRAREWVQLTDSGPRAKTGGYEACLPGEEVLELETTGHESRTVHAAECPPQKRAGLKTHTLDRQNSASRPPQIVDVIGSDWNEQVRRLAREKDLKINDLRHKGGALWVIGGPELKRDIEPLGFRYSPGRTAWWRK